MTATPSPSFPRRPQDAAIRGFTLIEIMVVVVIIGVLAAFIAPAVIGRIDDARATRARADIGQIDSALQLFRLDHSRYPTTQEGLRALVAAPLSADLRNWRAYLPSMPKDPWGRDYLYVQPGVRSTDFDLFTYGADGRPGGDGINADLGNWDVD